MSRYIKLANAYERDQQTILHPNVGGTGCVTLEDAKRALLIVDRGLIGRPGGPIELDENGKIKVEFLDLRAIDQYPTLELISGLDDDGNITLNREIGFKITNYNSAITYTVKEALNCVVNVTTDTLTFRASAANCYFYLNDRKIVPKVVAPTIARPTITTPVENATIDHSSINIVTSAFSVSGIAGETHVASWYKITSDAQGTDVIWESGRDTSNLTSLTANLPSALSSGATVYIFARHEGNIVGVSEWSEAVTCRVATLGVPVITSPLNNSSLSSRTATFTSSTFTTSGARTHAATDWVITRTDNGIEVIASRNDVTNKTSWTATNLPVNTTMQLVIRYKDSGGTWTEWSQPVSFTVSVAVNTPTITFPLNNTEYTTANLTIISSNFSSTNNIFRHGKSTWVVARDAIFANKVQETIEDENTLTNYVLNNPPIGVDLYVRVRYFAETGEQSQWSTAVKFRINVTVSTPTITTPATSQSEVAKDDEGYINISSSAYRVSSGTYAHTSTRWQVSTVDDFTTTLLDSVSGTATVGLTTLKIPNLLPSTTYYVRCMHTCSGGVSSVWSDVRSFTVASASEDASGRTFVRHSSGMGTVMTWLDKRSNQRKTLILDAAYRTTLPWAPSEESTEGLTQYSGAGYYLSSGTDTKSSQDTEDKTAELTDAFFGSRLSDNTINGYENYHEDTTGASNTAVLVQKFGQGTTYAAGYCNSKLINGSRCSLPNLQTLVRIYCSMFKLDQLDPTDSNNRYLFTLARSGNSYNWFFNNTATGVYASTEYDASNAWFITPEGRVDKVSKGTVCGVIPVKEIA